MSGGAVAVLIAAYQAEDTIAAAVESALSDSLVGEVVVVDDGSRDRTAATARAVDDGSGKLKIIVQPHNMGPSAARNAAIAASSAPYLAILDADDRLLPGRFARLLSYRGWDFIADNVAFVASTDHVDSVTEHLPVSTATRPLLLEEFVDRNIPRRGHPRSELGFLKPLIARAWLDAHGLRYDEAVRLGEDFLLYARALGEGARFLLAEACGYVAVERACSLSGTHSTQHLEALMVRSRALARSTALTAGAHRQLRRYAQSVEVKARHRRLLDRKTDVGVFGALADLARAPSMIAPVARAVIADKFGSTSPKPSVRLLLRPGDFVGSGA